MSFFCNYHVSSEIFLLQMANEPKYGNVIYGTKYLLVDLISMCSNYFRITKEKKAWAYTCRESVFFTVTLKWGVWVTREGMETNPRRGGSSPSRTRNPEAEPDVKESNIIQETEGSQRNYEITSSVLWVWPDSASKSQQNKGVMHRFLWFPW